MNGVNLLSPERVHRNRLRARMRSWSIVCAAFGLVGLGVVGAGAGSGTTPMPGRRTAESIRPDLEAKEAAIKAVRAEKAAQLRRAELVAAMTSHPDWAKLLDILAATRGPGVVFEHLEFRLTPRSAAGKGPQISTATLRITGVAESQVEATRYAVGLQDLGLFDKVSPVETRIRGGGDGQVGSLVGFSLTVTISGQEGGR